MRNVCIRVVVAAAVALSAPLALAQAGVTGAWKMTFQTDQGPADADLTLKQEGQKVTGNLSSPQGEAPVEGTFDDGKLKLTMKIDAQGQSFTMTLTGALEKNTLKGDADFGGIGTAQWSATRK
jgi:hypothetical protein